ncbi:hypothetical protein CRE_13491 [Caenorhabditis remanei]|uniref:Uncharacterized protein n=1 Tax=Caenorhabditis remanei TaxID=31234 RepID=E3MRA3_CAERE|nr:hypothetical protein CRE_13491 [Caenorhabditis remanei]
MQLSFIFFSFALITVCIALNNTTTNSTNIEEANRNNTRRSNRNMQLSILLVLCALITASLALIDLNPMLRDFPKRRKVTDSPVKMLMKSKYRNRAPRAIISSTHTPGRFRPFTGKRTTLKNWIV